MQAVTLIGHESRSVGYYLRPHLIPLMIWRHRDLIRQLTWRNLLARYRGSVLGLLWSFVLPLLMLTVYTFVFGVIFPKSRWVGVTQQSILTFALILYSGLIIYAVFSETLAASTTIIMSHASYVKKVVFPLEILPLCTLGAAMIQALISFVVLLICTAAIMWTVSPTLYYLPVVLVPLVMFTLGLGWWLASLGVYLRDMGQVMAVILQAMMFLTPIFYPIEALPQAFQIVMRLNPLTVVVENARRTLLWGQPPDWLWLGATTAASLVVMQLGYAWFMKTKRGFADVL